MSITMRDERNAAQQLREFSVPESLDPQGEFFVGVETFGPEMCLPTFNKYRLTTAPSGPGSLERVGLGPVQ